MARKGVSEKAIREAIAQLEVEGGVINVTHIRDKLGTGSFSTISATLQQWRDEKAAAHQPKTPSFPESVGELFQRIWAEAWASAYAQHETERRSFLEQKQAFAATERELQQEIASLEEQNSEQLKEVETLSNALALEEDSKQEVQLELVRVQAKADTLKLELAEVREERHRQSTQFAEWVERATKAENALEQLQSKQKKSRKV